MIIIGGTDIKSIFLNIASIFIFLIPFIIYYMYEYMYHYFGITMIIYFISYILSPIGWKRPHPYSDMTSNRTVGRKLNIQ